MHYPFASTGTIIALRAGVIDSGYRNEWFVALTNTTDKTVIIMKLTPEEKLLTPPNDVIIYPYDKAIAQALIVPIPKVKIQEDSY